MLFSEEVEIMLLDKFNVINRIRMPGTIIGGSLHLNSINMKGVMKLAESINVATIIYSRTSCASYVWVAIFGNYLGKAMVASQTFSGFASRVSASIKFIQERDYRHITTRLSPSWSTL